MFQVINHRIYYIVEFKEDPRAPISDGGDPALTLYAEALTDAIHEGIISKPGKYAIAVNARGKRWTAFQVLE